jgi:replication-associated recombination protein RarA
MSVQQNERALHESKVGGQQKVVRAAAEDVRRAVTQLETAARIGENTEAIEADVSNRLEYLLDKVHELARLRQSPAACIREDRPEGGKVVRLA